MPAITYPFIQALVADRSDAGTTTLDIGCGAGQYRAATKGRYVGLDVPQSRYGALPDVLGDGSRLPFRPDSFDLVFGVATFYLIPDARRCFRDCRQVLRPDGRLLLVGYQPRVSRGHRAGDPGHRHTWSYAQLRDELQAAGFHQVTQLADRAYADPDLGLARQLVRRARTASRFARIWMIVEARP